jgi:hypothetical protein
MLSGGKGLALGVLPEEEGVEELSRTFNVRVSERGALHALEPQVVKARGMVLKLLRDFPQAASAGDLGIHHHHELSPTVKMAVSALRAEALFLDT